MKRVASFCRVWVLVLSCLAVVIACGSGRTAAFESELARVIVQGETTKIAARAVKAVGGRVTADLGFINSVAATVPAGSLAKLKQMAGVVHVTDDGTVRAAGSKLDVEFGKAIGMEEVWEAGLTGQGVTVAVLDSGLDVRMNALGEPGQNEDDATNSRILAYCDILADEVYEAKTLNKAPGDLNGHGTHVSSIIANGEYERSDNEYRGVAPQANLVAIRVLDENGVGTYSDVLKGIQWIIEQKDKYNIRVLNVSMYAPVNAPYWADPYNLAVMAAWKAGIVVVASAGNGGPDPMSIGVPGNTPYVITVGAFTDNYTPESFGDDYLAPFSAAGPTLDRFVKPDVIAPGAHVVSLMRNKTTLGELYPENRVRGHYFRMAGTSMSAAVVSGLAALMLEQHPGLTPDEVKYRLSVTARPHYNEQTGEVVYSVWQQGAGRVWAPDAVFADIQGSANQGLDIDADLAGEVHYQGWTTFDPDTGEFGIQGFESWAGGFESWAGGFESWAGGFESWAGGFESWAGGFESWAGGFESWAGGFESWAGGFESWAGGFESWAGGYATWAGGFESWAGNAGDPTWASMWMCLENVPTDTAVVGMNNWVTESQ